MATPNQAKGRSARLPGPARTRFSLARENQVVTRGWRAALALLGLLLLPYLSACGSKAQAPTQIAVVQRDLTYPGVGGIALAGTLLIPAHNAGTRVPGVILVAGSGPVDRNGNIAAAGYISNLYGQLADQLAQQGIASLRYDKRGIGASTPYPHPHDASHPTPAEIAALQDFFAWDNYVGDARATWNELQQQPEIDPARTALIGHSEGGVTVEQVAATSLGPAHPPAALVLISAPGRPLGAILHEQLAHGYARDPAIAAAPVLSTVDEIIASLRQTGQVPSAAFADLKANPQVPAQVVQNLEALFQPAYDKLWHGELQVDPAAAAKQYPGPVLVMQGASDVQVFASEDTPLLDAALKSRTPDDHRVVIIPNTSHDMKAVKDPQTDPGVAGPVVPACADALRNWLAEKLAEKPTAA